MIGRNDVENPDPLTDDEADKQNRREQHEIRENICSRIQVDASDKTRIYATAFCPVGKYGLSKISAKDSGIVNDNSNNFRKKYIPRQDLENKLSEKFSIEGTEVTVAVSGIAGSGKHFLVYNYSIRQFFEKYHAVIWIQKSDEELEEEIKSLMKLHLSDSDYKTTSIAQFLESLSENRLLVIVNCQYSNYSNTRIFNSLPLRKHLVIISRIQQEDVENIEVDQMTESEANKLLYQGINDIGLKSTDKITSQISDIVKYCYFYPLPIMQVLNYVKRKKKFPELTNEFLRLLSAYPLSSRPWPTSSLFDFFTFINGAIKTAHVEIEKNFNTTFESCIIYQAVAWLREKNLESDLKDEVIEKFFKDKHGSLFGGKNGNNQVERIGNFIEIAKKFFLTCKNSNGNEEFKELISEVLHSKLRHG